MSKRLNPNKVASISSVRVPESVPKKRTSEHYSINKRTFISLCQLERGMKEY
jgi:hypothetical protein